MFASKNEAITVIRDILSKFNNIEIPDCETNEFVQLSYSKIAVENSINAIQNDGSNNALYILEQLLDKLNMYSCINSFNSYMYSIQANTIEYIIDTIIARKEKEKL